MKKPSKPLHARGELRSAIRRQPVVFAVYLVLRLIVLASLVSAILRQEYESAFVCVLVLFLFMLPFFIQKNFGIRLPGVLEIIILLFIFAAEILGELQCYFVESPHWDTMLHTTSGFLAAAVGFSLVDLLNRDAKIKFQLSPLYVAIAAFCFAMTVGVLWEFVEFAADRIFLLDMQKDTVVHTISSVMLDEIIERIDAKLKQEHPHTTLFIVKDGQAHMANLSVYMSTAVNGVDLGLGGYLDIGLYDTMEDLFVSFVGAVTFSVIGYFYLKKRGQGTFVRQFIPTIREDDTADHEEKTDAPEAGDGI